MIAAETWDIIIDYHDGVLSVSQWVVAIVVACLLAVSAK